MVFRYASRPMMLALALTVPALAILYVQIVNSEPQPWYWIGFILFGVLTFLALQRLVDSTPVVRIGAPGISDARLRVGLVPWDKVDAVELLPAQASLRVTVTDAELAALGVPRPRFFHLLVPSAHAVPGSSGITIAFKGLVPGVDEAWDYICTNFPDKADAPGRPRASGAAPSG